MRDAFEATLADRLRTLGDTVADELPPPVDLELQVGRRKRRARVARRWAALSVAASLVTAATAVAVVRGTSGRDAVRVATSQTSSPSTAAPFDPLQPGTVMLSARGRYVISLDATGHTNATMVESAHQVTYARATADHRHIWYLSLVDGTKGCGAVVRADIDGQTSTIVTHAVAFDVSPDGSRLALYGAGDLAHDGCLPVTPGRQGHVVVVDLASHRSSRPVTYTGLTGMRWSPDGSYLVVVACTGGRCDGPRVVDGPDVPDGSLSVSDGVLSLAPAQNVHSSSVAFGPEALYVLEATTSFPRATSGGEPGARIGTLDPRSATTGSVVFSGGDRWDVGQVVPTADATYVVAAPVKAGARALRWGLYRLESGRLVLVRGLTDPGVFSAVLPLATP